MQAAYHLLITDRTKIDTGQKYSKFLQDNMTLVATKNIRDCDKELIFRAKYSTYIAKSKGPKLDSLVTPCFDVPQLQKNF